MDRFSILKNPDLKPHHAYALTPEERRIKEEEKRFREQRARRSPSDIERELIRDILSAMENIAQNNQNPSI